MSESKEIRVLRTMEWERVKGSLNAILQTYWKTVSPAHLQESPSKFDRMDSAVNRFVKEVEDEGLQE